jgi:hypothetical protein
VHCKKFQETPMAFPKTPESGLGQAAESFNHGAGGERDGKAKNDHGDQILIDPAGTVLRTRLVCSMRCRKQAGCIARNWRGFEPRPAGT